MAQSESDSRQIISICSIDKVDGHSQSDHEHEENHLTSLEDEPLHSRNDSAEISVGPTKTHEKPKTTVIQKIRKMGSRKLITVNNELRVEPPLDGNPLFQMTNQHRWSKSTTAAPPISTDSPPSNDKPPATSNTTEDDEFEEVEEEEEEDEEDWSSFLEEKGRKLQRAAMEKLAKRINTGSSAFSILDNENRYLIKEGAVKRQGRLRTVTRYLLLFNDILLFTSAHGGHYTLKQTLDLSKVHIHNYPGSKSSMKNSFIIQTQEKEYCVAAPNSVEKNAWMKTLTSVIIRLHDPLQTVMQHLKSLQSPANPIVTEQVAQVLTLLEEVRKNNTPGARAKVRLQEQMKLKLEKQDEDVQAWLVEGFLHKKSLAKRPDDLESSEMSKQKESSVNNLPSRSGSISLHKRPSLIWSTFFAVAREHGSLGNRRVARILSVHRERQRYTAANENASKEEIIAHLRQHVKETGEGLKAVHKVKFFSCSLLARFTLRKVFDWDAFSVFRLDQASHGHPLPLLLFHLMEEFGFFRTFKMNQATFTRFAFAIEAGYNDVPYHNRLHATDVLQNMAVFLRTELLAKALSPQEKFAALIAAAVHDYKHDGYNNAFHCNTSSEHAINFNDQSVLENMHLAEMFKLVAEPETNIMSAFKTADRKEIREIIILMVLSTDMKKHFVLHQELDTLLNAAPVKKISNRTSVIATRKVGGEGSPGGAGVAGKSGSVSAASGGDSAGGKPVSPGGGDLPGQRKALHAPRKSILTKAAVKEEVPMPRTERLLFLKAALHCCDLGNPAKPLELYLHWAKMIMMEFFAQGDAEKQLGLAISPMCDRSKPNTEKSQIGFIGVIVAPLFRTMATLLPEVADMCNQLKVNENYWKNELEKKRK